MLKGISGAVEMDHDLENRNITVALIEQSELARYGQSNKRGIRVTPNEWTDAVIGWVTNISSIKTNNGALTVKKKRPVERSFTDIQFQSPNQGDDYWSNNSSISEIRVRCIGDQEKTFPIPPWKSNIEQGTYRYIPDNGSYRTLKFMYDDRRDWYTIRKKHPEKVSTAWHQNCKRLQREMRRQLKKDISRAEKERGNNSARSSSTRNSVDPITGSETSRSNSFIHSKTENQSERSTPNKVDYQGVKSIPEPETEKVSVFTETNKHRERKETRVKSTHSDGAMNHLRKMKTIHEREVETSHTPMPHYSIPSSGQMLKSASDLFIENFSSRISALEDEIKKDSKWLRKNENELTKIQGNRPKYREQSRANLKENGHSNSTTPRSQFKTETLGCEVFSVKPMVQKELKPVEKSKSFKGDGSRESRRTPQSKGSLSNANHNTNDAMINYSSENDSHKYPSASDNNKQALFNTLTGTKINTQNSKRPSKGFTTPSTITLCDNNSPTNTNGPPPAKHLEPYQHILLEKKPSKREAIQSIPAIQNITALLPEISGKRLEVASVSHRLL